MCDGPGDPCPNCGRRGQSDTEFKLNKFALRWLELQSMLALWSETRDQDSLHFIDALKKVLNDLAREVAQEMLGKRTRVS